MLLTYPSNSKFRYINYIYSIQNINKEFLHTSNRINIDYYAKDIIHVLHFLLDYQHYYYYKA